MITQQYFLCLRVQSLALKCHLVDKSLTFTVFLPICEVLEMEISVPVKYSSRAELRFKKNNSHSCIISLNQNILQT